VGSRLSEVIDTHSKRTDAHRRFRATLRWVVKLAMGCIACSWLFLYSDSVYQRRRAESLFADLKSFDFATADFPEVRDIMNRNGGAAIQRDLHGNVTFERPGPTCTPEDCTFQLWITTWPARTPLLDRMAEFFYTNLPYVGVRSWVLYARLEVRNGKLDRSYTAVSELKMERFDSRMELVPLGYEVEVQRDSANFHCPGLNREYRVYIDHNDARLPENVLSTCVLQSAGIPTKRAFNVHLRCLNGLFRSCRFDELAPSAWADYSAMTALQVRDRQ
jgi:hypothetical protein